MHSRSKTERLASTRSSFNVQEGESQSPTRKLKPGFAQEFELLFTKINNVRDWTKNLIKDSCAVVDLEPNMNVTKYLQDSDKRHLRRSNLEILGVDMMSAAKHSGIKGSIYERALLKVGECERNLGTYSRDLIIDVCSSFIKPLKHFLSVDVNKLLEEKEMLTSRKVDYDYHLRQLSSKKDDKTAQHKFKMAEMALEFQFVHAKEIFEEIEASECQVGHLRDLVNVQALYHKKCLDDLEELKQQLQNVSFGGNNRLSLRRVTETSSNSNCLGRTTGNDYVAGDGRTVSNARFTIRCERHSPSREFPKIAASIQKSLCDTKRIAEGDDAEKNGRANPGEQRICREQCSSVVHVSSTIHQAQPRSRCLDLPRPQSLTRYPVHHQNTSSSLSINRKCRNEPDKRESSVGGSLQDRLDSPRGSACGTYSNKHLVSSSGCHKTSGCPPFSIEPILSDGNEDRISESTGSKEACMITIPFRADYRRSVGKIFFKPRDELDPVT